MDAVLINWFMHVWWGYAFVKIERNGKVIYMWPDRMFRPKENR